MSEIRSYRRVFDLERRVYSIDSLRLNPGGVPVRGIVYLLAILAAALVATRLPLIGSAIRVVPWYLRDLALPAAVASVLSLLRVDGRTFHLTACALVSYWVGPHRLTRLRRARSIAEIWLPNPVLFLPDGSDGRMRRLRYRGPGAVLVTCEHERAHERRQPSLPTRNALVLRQSGTGRALAEGKVIALARGARLLVESAREESSAR